MPGSAFRRTAWVGRACCELRLCCARLGRRQRVATAGDVVSKPPGAWHWHGATPGTAAIHVRFEAPGDFDLAVERCDWDETYSPDLGS